MMSNKIKLLLSVLVIVASIFAYNLIFRVNIISSIEIQLIAKGAFFLTDICLIMQIILNRK
ncbi:MAG: hypothetical protein ACRCUS_10150 [Anaerovoracaceae bacterium]